MCGLRDIGSRRAPGSYLSNLPGDGTGPDGRLFRGRGVVPEPPCTYTPVIRTVIGVTAMVGIAIDTVMDIDIAIVGGMSGRAVDMVDRRMFAQLEYTDGLQYEADAYRVDLRWWFDAQQPSGERQFALLRVGPRFDAQRGARRFVVDTVGLRFVGDRCNSARRGVVLYDAVPHPSAHCVMPDRAA